MAWVNFDTEQKSWLVQWKVPFGGKKRYQFCLRVRCNAVGGDKVQAEHVARRLKEEIDVAEDKSTKPVFQTAMDCIIAEVLSAMPQDESCHCVCLCCCHRRHRRRCHRNRESIMHYIAIRNAAAMP